MDRRRFGQLTALFALGAALLAATTAAGARISIMSAKALA